MTATSEPLEPFECPRCATTVHERFWGPCADCRAALVAAYRDQEGRAMDSARPVESGRYEPAMHVVPNHVATKD